MATRSNTPFNTKTTSTASLSPKLPPQNIEAEQSLLGALLIDKDAVANISESLRPENFYKSEQHGAIYSAIVTLYEKREPIDVVTVTEKLKQMGYLDKVGGPAYLTELVNMVPTAAHVETYAKIIREHSMRRTLISFSTKFTDMAFDEGVEVNEVLEECEQSIFGLSQHILNAGFQQEVNN
jgi:replicative DNA helicase